MNKLHQEDVRKKIQASQLINRLTDHALGKTELSATQIKAAEILLKKSMPDLSSVEMNATVTTRTLDQELSDLNAQRNAEGSSPLA